MNICGLMLAAGSAIRFGEQKLLYPLPSGEKIIELSAQTLKKAIPHTVAVVQSDTDDLSKILMNLGYEIVVNPNPQSGISSSIVCGMINSNADAWVITLADMPYVQLDTINTIVKYLQDGEKIVAPLFKQQRGHPVGFSSLYKDQLIKLKGDMGAKNIMQKNKDNLKLFDSNDPGVIHDIDYKKDLDLGIV
jgi:molybdenum cofactor cytidylyltransferase